MMRLMIKLKNALENEQTGDVMARTNQEMSSLGYKCEDQSHIEIGRVVARNIVFIGNGFVCGEQNQREVTINFVVHLNNLDKTNCDVQLVSTGIYSGYVADVTPRVSWHENQSTWLGIALRLYRESSDWEGKMPSGIPMMQAAGTGYTLEVMTTLKWAMHERKTNHHCLVSYYILL